MRIVVGILIALALIGAGWMIQIKGLTGNRAWARDREEPGERARWRDLCGEHARRGDDDPLTLPLEL